jgi:hypothetical protein
MSTASSKIQDLAGRLLALEAAQSKSSDDYINVLMRACERLRATLSKLVGVPGFASLLSRALALAKAEVPALEVVKVRADGSLEGLAEAEQDQGPVPLGSGGDVLVAQLLGLLVTFIGPSLTLRLVRDAWTDLSWEGMDPSDEETP